MKTLKNCVLPLLKSGSEVAQKAATASSSTASIRVESYNQISRHKKRNVIDLKSKRPPAVQMMQYNVKKILNSQRIEEDLERKKKSSHPPPKKSANPDQIMLPSPQKIKILKA